MGMTAQRRIAPCIGTVLLLALLAGCSEADPVPVTEPPVRLQAGQWTITHRLTGYNYPGVTAQEYAARVGKQVEAKLCLNIDDQGLPDAVALAGPQGKGCRLTSGSATKGRFAATLACKSDVTITLEGNYRANSLSLGSRMTSPMGGDAALRTTSDVSGTRTGDCG